MVSKTGGHTCEEPVLRPLEIWTSSNPVDLGWWTVRSPLIGAMSPRVGELWVGATGLTWEVVVKVYGVAATMP